VSDHKEIVLTKTIPALNSSALRTENIFAFNRGFFLLTKPPLNHATTHYLFIFVEEQLQQIQVFNLAARQKEWYSFHKIGKLTCMSKCICIFSRVFLYVCTGMCIHIHTDTCIYILNWLMQVYRYSLGGNSFIHP